MERQHFNKISGTVGHGGGIRYASTTAEYSVLESWAQSVETAPDSDGDGVLDQDDAFPNDSAASVDTDGDGSPDDWNPNATLSR